jgi:hypothetical protein
MRRLADGKTEDAHQLWQKVLETRMFSFFEFEMASRYLRLGAPTTPPTPASPRSSPVERSRAAEAARVKGLGLWASGLRPG